MIIRNKQCHVKVDVDSMIMFFLKKNFDIMSIEKGSALTLQPTGNKYKQNG